MICEKIGRSKAGKTYILRVLDDGRVEITGDFFTSEEDLRKIEEALQQGRKPEGVYILGVDVNELYEKYEECVEKKGMQ